MKCIVAACQPADTQGDTAKTLSLIAQCAADADKAGISVLCFPECYYQGYTRDKVIAHQRAIELDGPEFTSLLEQLANYKVTIILGLIERAGNELFNTAIVVQNGKLVGKYRKAHPHEGIFEAGTEYPVFDGNGVRFGINICNDANYPETADELLKSKPAVIFYPLNNRLATQTAEKWHDKHIYNLIDRANQTSCWIVSSDIVYEDDEAIGYGFTAIVNPAGEVVAQADELTEQMITASM